MLVALCLSTSYADCIYGVSGGKGLWVLCLSTSYADCIRPSRPEGGQSEPLPQHVLRGLHRAAGAFDAQRPHLCLSTSYADCIGKNAQSKAGVYDGRCCESVDSFSIIEER